MIRVDPDNLIPRASVAEPEPHQFGVARAVKLFGSRSSSDSSGSSSDSSGSEAEIKHRYCYSFSLKLFTFSTISIINRFKDKMARPLN
jgi:hypothetical protein